jgi:hypothetical protein
MHQPHDARLPKRACDVARQSSVMYANSRSHCWTRHGFKHKVTAVVQVVKRKGARVSLRDQTQRMRKEEYELTSRDLEHATASHSENILVNPDFDSTARDMEDHVIGRAVLCAFHLVFVQLEEAPAHVGLGLIVIVCVP